MMGSVVAASNPGACDVAARAHTSRRVRMARFLFYVYYRTHATARGRARSEQLDFLIFKKKSR